MISKCFKVSFFFLFITFITLGQISYPIGAKWYYTQSSFWSPAITYSTMEVVADTTINGIDCQKLSKLSGCDFLGGTAFIYADSNKVFFYNNYLQTFVLLYDFNANAGDSWVIYPESPNLDSVVVYVDSTGTEIVNSDTLKVLFTSSSFGNFWFGGAFLEGIGSKGYFFPQFSICDPPSGPLRCYSDSLLGNYETGVADSCDEVITMVSYLLPENNVRIFPNPVNDFLKFELKNIKLQRDESCSLTIYDSFGRSVLKEEFPSIRNITINTSKLAPGFYHSIISINKSFKHFNFIKN